MQVKIWYDQKENKIVAQLGDDRKSRKSIPWDDFGQFDQENPWTATFTAADALSAPPGAGVLPPALAPEHRAPGERPMALQDADIRRRHQEVRDQEAAEASEQARQEALENETATSSDGVIYEETAEAREDLEEAQDEYQDAGMEAETDEELEEAEEDVEDAAEEVEEIADRSRNRGQRTQQAARKRSGAEQDTGRKRATGRR